MTQDFSDVPTDTNNPGWIPEENNQTTQDAYTQWQQWDQEETQKLKEEIAQLREQLARSQADYNNLVRRSRDESAQIGEWTENKTILKFLPILDNLERAVEHTPEEFKSHAWAEWLHSIVRAMQKVLSDMWVMKMNAAWQEVNPDYHDVISQIPAKTTNIQAEVESGYIRSEKALRHAKVIVGDGSISE
jgi:molecular chaperone GrpE